jgi:hypothetical protein
MLNKAFGSVALIFSYNKNIVLIIKKKLFYLKVKRNSLQTVKREKMVCYF